MGRLVEPLYQIEPQIEQIIEFKGLNLKTVIGNGEMRAMENLSSDGYPNLTQRKPRGTYYDGREPGTSRYEKVVQILTKSMLVEGVQKGPLAVLDYSNSEYRFFYMNDGVPYEITGTERFPRFTEKQKMVAINNYICFFPAKSYFDIKTGLTGALNALETAETAAITLGSESTTIDMDGSKFKANDAVRITGTLVYGEETKAIEISCEVLSATDTSITVPKETFLELDGEGLTTATLTGAIVARWIPELKFVIESGNRLWGVNDNDNTIYSSKLGDPSNWEYYQNTSLDSYAATQGTDGVWTGCAKYSGHLLFFKSNYIHRVYGSMPSQYQISVMEASGIEEGCEDSVATIEDIVFYKSLAGIMAYSGSRPQLISGNFGANDYHKAVAGADRRKYYVSMQNSLGTYDMFVFDTGYELWHREDNTQAISFAMMDEKLFYVNEAGVIKVISAENWSNGVRSINIDSEEAALPWCAELGPFDEYIEMKKVVSRMFMRLNLEEGSTVTVSVKADAGEWEEVYSISDKPERACTIPIVPRRCQHFSIKLSGTGRCKIESILRKFRTAQGRF